jgi:hypothetical protein
MSSSWKVNLMIELNYLILNKEHTIIHILKALASIISMSDLYVILKITPRYITLFTNRMFRPFNVRWNSGGPIIREKQIPRILPSLILIFQHLHRDSIELRPRCSFLITKPSLWSVAHREVSSTRRPRYVDTRCGTRLNFVFSLGLDISLSIETLNRLREGREKIILIKLVKNSKLHNLYSKTECPVVSKAFILSKNTPLVNIKTKTKFHGFSLQENYTDRVTAACRRS